MVIVKFYIVLIICQLHDGGYIQCEFYVFVNKVLKLVVLYWLALQCRWLHWQQQIGLNPLFLCHVSHGPLQLQYLPRYAR